MSGGPVGVIRIESPVALIELILGCSAFGLSTTLPSCYQAKRNMGKKYSFVKLIGIRLNN